METETVNIELSHDSIIQQPMLNTKKYRFFLNFVSPKALIIYFILIMAIGVVCITIFWKYVSIRKDINYTLIKFCSIQKENTCLDIDQNINFNIYLLLLNHTSGQFNQTIVLDNSIDGVRLAGNIMITILLILILAPIIIVGTIICEYISHKLKEKIQEIESVNQHLLK